MTLSSQPGPAPDGSVPPASPTRAVTLTGPPIPPTGRLCHARLPASAHAPAPEHVDKIPYGRFRNVYLYITESCQLWCEHCYLGKRLGGR